MHAQNDTLGTPFKKGKFFTELSGTISSGGIRQSSSSFATSVFENRYSIGTTSGFFIKDRWGLGITLNLARQGNNEAIKYSSESLNLGATTRYYFSKESSGSLFLEFAVFYANLNLENKSNDTSLVYHVVTTGNGIGSNLGVGFTYALNQTVGFNMGIRYATTYFWGKEKDLVKNEVESSQIIQENLLFHFGFIIFINEFFY
jgi:outer membrane protein W